MIGGSVLTIALFFIVRQFIIGESSAEEFSPDEVSSLVESQFQAEVISTNLLDDYYEVLIDQENGRYVVMVDRDDGTVLDITLKEAYEKETDVVEKDEER